MPKQYYKVKNYQARRSVGYLLRLNGKLITSHLEAIFVKRDVSFVQWVILMNLRDKLASTAGELCQRLCHDSGALTRVLDQMEKRKWIKRKRSKQDRRIVALEITAEGLKITELFLPEVVDVYNNLMADFTQEEADMVVGLLTRLAHKLSQPLNISAL